MNITLKKAGDQVIVITGASSGIGLTTARSAARRGARLVLVSRNGEALEKLADELRNSGGDAHAVTADVADVQQVRHVADEAIRRFGRIDTWINNAGVSIFGRFEDVPLEDQRRLFDTNFWGVVHGSLVAVEHLRKQGGALINLGSELSDCAVPLQGMYTASKHAIKGFTDSLRMELEEEGAPVSVTLIKPAAIDTMFLANAKNYMDVEPRLPPPIYAPQVAADAILSAAETPIRDVFVGGAAKAASSSAHYMPAVLDRIMSTVGYRQQRGKAPAGDREHNSLYRPQPDTALRQSQGQPGYVFRSSLYTRAATAPNAGKIAMAGAGLALAALWQARRPNDR
ncbi:MAG: SDR family oxidoreductase [Burkholderiaceae bacterium]